MKRASVWRPRERTGYLVASLDRGLYKYLPGLSAAMTLTLQAGKEDWDTEKD